MVGLQTEPPTGAVRDRPEPYPRLLRRYDLNKSKRASNKMNVKDTLDTEVIVKGNTLFAFDLYGQLKAAKGNLFFSPYSI